jgi:hypothetical protein
VPKHDLAKEIAKAIFENDPDMIYKAFRKALARGNAYSFQVLADRAYGKLKERHEVDVSPYHEYTDEELQKRVHELEEQLGYRTPEVLPPSADPDSDSKPN